VIPQDQLAFPEEEMPVRLSKRGARRFLAMLENPPRPNARRAEQPNASKTLWLIGSLSAGGRGTSVPSLRAARRPWIRSFARSSRNMGSGAWVEHLLQPNRVRLALAAITR